MKVLFVCTGNLCRSPMAEVLLRAELARRGCGEIEAASAGTWAGDGAPATSDAVAAMAARDVDLAGHLSRALSPREVEAADIVIAMTSVHVREILAEAPGAAGKVLLLKELAEIERSTTGQRDAAARLAALLGGRRPPGRRSLDVDDPMGLPSSSYERCARELEAGVKVLAGVLCPGPPGSVA